MTKTFRPINTDKLVFTYVWVVKNFLPDYEKTLDEYLKWVAIRNTVPLVNRFTKQFHCMYFEQALIEYTHWCNEYQKSLCIDNALKGSDGDNEDILMFDSCKDDHYEWCVDSIERAENCINPQEILNFKNSF